MTDSMFTWSVRVYYEDTDAAGIVYHASYLKFMERARTEWLRSLGFDQAQLVKDMGILFAVRSIAIDFIAPARLDQELVVRSSVKRIRGASIDFEQLIVDDETRQISRADVRGVCLDSANMKPARVPPALMAVFHDAN